MIQWWQSASAPICTTFQIIDTVFQTHWKKLALYGPTTFKPIFSLLKYVSEQMIIVILLVKLLLWKSEEDILLLTRVFLPKSLVYERLSCVYLILLQFFPTLHNIFRERQSKTDNNTWEVVSDMQKQFGNFVQIAGR